MKSLPLSSIIDPLFLRIHLWITSTQLFLQFMTKQTMVSEEYIFLLSLVLEMVAVLYPSLPDTRPPWRCSGTCRLLEVWSRHRSSPAAWGPVGTSCAPGQSTPRSWNSGRSGSAMHSMTTSAGTLSGCCLPCSWSVTIYTLLSISCFCSCCGLFICQL